jgi:hypothetical protein
MVIRMNTFIAVPNAEDATALGPDADRAMTRAIQRLAASRLSELRREFPDAPLAVRIRALAALRKR